MCKEFCFFLKVVILTDSSYMVTCCLIKAISTRATAPISIKSVLKNILSYKQIVTILAILSCPSRITAIITYTCCLVAASARYITDMLTVPSKKVILTFYKKVTNICFFVIRSCKKKKVFSSKKTTLLPSVQYSPW